MTQQFNFKDRLCQCSVIQEHQDRTCSGASGFITHGNEGEYISQEMV